MPRYESEYEMMCRAIRRECWLSYGCYARELRVDIVTSINSQRVKEYEPLFAFNTIIFAGFGRLYRIRHAIGNTPLYDTPDAVIVYVQLSSLPLLWLPSANRR